MSCVTVPKRWEGAESKVERAGTPLQPRAVHTIRGTTLTRRTVKKARSTPQLLDSVREVVQAFEFEYAQVRAESKELKTVLDERKTQLSTLRHHLERESNDSGVLEAQVQDRRAKNTKGDAQLAELEQSFELAVASNSDLMCHISGAKADLETFRAEHSDLRERLAVASEKQAQLEAVLVQRERALSMSLEKNKGLHVAVDDGCREVDKKLQALRVKREEASSSKSRLKEAEVELETLLAEVTNLRRCVQEKTGECERAFTSLQKVNAEADQSRKDIEASKASMDADIEASNQALGLLKQQISEVRKTCLEVEGRAEASQSRIEAEKASQATRREELTTLVTSTKETAEKETTTLQSRLEQATADVAQAQASAREASAQIEAANKEFTDLMGAMSNVFLEYDAVTTSNRELEREVTDAEGVLAAHREASARDIESKGSERDRLLALNAEARDGEEAERQELGMVREEEEAGRENVARAKAALEGYEKMVHSGKERLRKAEASCLSQSQENQGVLETERVLVDAAATEVSSGRARAEKLKAELDSIGGEDTAPLPAPVLDEEDMRRVAAEAEAACQRLRSGDTEFEVARKDLEDTLTTIRLGGAERLQSEKAAAAARLASLEKELAESSSALTKITTRKAIADAEVEEAKANLAKVTSRDPTATGATKVAAPPQASVQEPSFSPEMTSASQPPLNRQACLSKSLPPKTYARKKTKTRPIHSTDLSLQRPTPSRTTSSSSREIHTKEAKDNSRHGRSGSAVSSRHENKDGSRSTATGGTSGKHQQRGQRQIASESTAEDSGVKRGHDSQGKRRSSKERFRKKDSSKKKGSKGPSLLKESDPRRPSASKKDRGRQDSNNRSSQQHRHQQVLGMGRSGSGSRSRSPRHSNPPPEKEYDLWTDNKLVGDKEFSFF